MAWTPPAPPPSPLCSHGRFAAMSAGIVRFSQIFGVARQFKNNNIAREVDHALRRLSLTVFLLSPIRVHSRHFLVELLSRPSEVEPEPRKGGSFMGDRKG